MSRKKVDTKYMQVVMQQFNDGKKIQMREKTSDSEWEDVENPSWNWAKYDFRKKPKIEYVAVKKMKPKDKHDGLQTFMFVGDEKRIVTSRTMFCKIAELEDDEMLLVTFKSIEVVKKRKRGEDVQ